MLKGRDKVKQLREHQVEAKDAIHKALRSADRTTFVSATGTGKTVTLNEVSVGFADKIVLFFPSLSLVNQTIREWRDQGVRGYTYVAVCSDSTVASVRSDSLVVTDEELAESGALVTRDADLLKSILTSKKKVVVFATYHSADKVEEAGVSYDLMICDESHHLTGVGTFGKAVLDDNRIYAKKRIFATATPRVYTFKGDSKEVEVRSMDDESLFGEVCYTLGLRESINKGILSPYKVYIVELTDEDFKPYGIDPSDEQNALTRMVMGVAAYKRMQKELGVKRTISYLSSRRRAKEFAEMVSGDFITGNMKSSERAEILNRLVNEGGVVSNVRCLAEGVDVPALDAVEFVDPRNSKVEIVQAVGRVIRVSSGKGCGYVILPVLAESYDEGGKNTYSQVWDVLTQMAENDTLLRAQINVAGGYYSQADKDEAGSAENVIQVLGDTTQGIATEAAEKLAKRISLRVAHIVDPDLTWLQRHWEYVKSIKTMSEIIHEARLGLINGNLPQTRADDLDREAPGWRGE